MKQLIKRIMGRKILFTYYKLKLSYRLRINFKKDYDLYKKYSYVIKNDTIKKKESFITVRYHSLEKGFLHDPIRFRFAKDRVVELINCLKDVEVLDYLEKTQLQAAISILCNYYELHESSQQDISDYFIEEDYQWLKGKLIQKHPCNVKKTNKDYFANSEGNFLSFSGSRHSVRSFSGEIVSENLLKKVVKLANNAPSVCNRQGVSVVIVENKEKIDKMVDIQGGLKGFSKNLNQLIVLICNRNIFYSIGERNQLYVDGGIYLMNLLYALHYYKIAACPAHWAMPIESDEIMHELLSIPDSFKIISFVAIGIPTDTFPVTPSLKRTEDENLIIIK